MKKKKKKRGTVCSRRGDTADAEIKAPTPKDQRLSKVLPLKPGAGQGIASRALPADGMVPSWFIQQHFSQSSPNNKKSQCHER